MALSYRFTSQQIVNEKRTTKELIQAIKIWQMKTESIPALPEEFICLFLIACQNDVATAKTTIENYFRIKAKCSCIFDQCDLERSELQKVLTVGCFCVVPRRMDGNCAIALGKLKDTNYKNYDFISCVKVSDMFLHSIQNQDPPSELIVILDFNGMSLMHLTRIKVRAASTYMQYMQEALPIRLRTVHVLNASLVFHKLWKMFGKFMQQNLVKILKTHEPGMNMEDFYRDWVPKDYLPLDYGGVLPPMDELMRPTVDGIRRMRDFFVAEEHLRRHKELHQQSNA